jgi:hypothetical protein
MTRIWARFDGRVLIPVEPVNLAPGQLLELDMNVVSEPAKGSPGSLLRAMDEPPFLEPGDREALERAIHEGKLPVRYDAVFGEEE